jgi:hypothetical protein
MIAQTWRYLFMPEARSPARSLDVRKEVHP